MGYVWLTPPFDAPDETNHFLKAWSVSEGHLLLQPTPDHRLGDTLPIALATLCHHFRPGGHAPVVRIPWTDIRNMMSHPLSPHQRGFVDFANTGMYAPLAYLPAAGIIRVMRWFGAPPLLTLYGIRSLHLLLWLWMMWTILKQGGSTRWLLLYAGLLPGVMVFQSSANPDAVVHAGVWWAIIQVWQGQPDMYSRMGSGLLVVLSSIQKLIFVPLAGLFWHRGSWRQAVLWTGLALVVALLWGIRARQTFVPFDDYHPAFRESQTLNPGIDPEAQRAEVLRHPLVFISRVIAGAARSAPSTIAHLAGKYGWNKHYLPGWVMALILFGLCLVMTSTPNDLTIGDRLLLAGIAVSVFLLFSLTNYLLWNPVGADRLDNFQGRYFIGILPLVLMAGSVDLLPRPLIVQASQIFLIFGHLYMLLLLIQSIQGGY